jgi:hypothetical protein
MLRMLSFDVCRHAMLDLYRGGGGRRVLDAARNTGGNMVAI